jgi:phospholipase C
MKTHAAIVALGGLLAASSAVANPVPSQGDPYAQVGPAPFKYEAGSKESIANLKSKIKHVVWILLENRSFDNILGGVNRKGLDNPANNGDYCMPQNLSLPDGPKFCSRNKDFDSVLNDPDHSVTGNNFEFYGQFAPNNADIASGKLKPVQTGFVEKQLISYPTLAPQTAAEQVLGYYSEDEIPTLVDLVDGFTTFNRWHSCVPGVCLSFHHDHPVCALLTACRSRPTRTVCAPSPVRRMVTETTTIASTSPASRSRVSSRRLRARASAG